MPEVVRAFAPGRVNLIGEHTDYNGGLALPFAIGDGVTVQAERLAGERIEAVALDLGEEDAFSLRDPEPIGGWRAFARGAVAELAVAGIELRGARLSFGGPLRAGAGLSSSAALSVALCLALVEIGSSERRPDRLELARICSAIEHRWLGAQTGLLDQLACLAGRRDRAVRIDFASLAVTPVPLRLGDHRLVVLHSGQSRRLATSGYNTRRQECAEACRRLGVRTLSEANLPDADTLPEPLGGRLRHVITENRRVERAVWWLERGDVWELGPLLDASHASLRDDYEVSTAAVEAAVERLRAAGSIGTRLIGGGFGGSVLALMPPGTRAPEGAVEVQPGDGASVVRAAGRRDVR